MSDIQRWDMNHVQGEVYIDKKPEGSWVTYADHVAAVAAARTMGYVEGQADMRKYLLADDTHSFTYGYREGVKAARDAVEAIPTSAFDIGIVSKDEVLAAIDALPVKGSGNSDGNSVQP